MGLTSQIRKEQERYDFYMAEEKNRKKKKQDVEVSKSKVKREERQKEVSKARHTKLAAKVAGIVAGVAVVGVIAGAIGFNVYKVAMRTTSSSDLSAGLSDNGIIEGVDIDQILTLSDYKSLTVPKKEVAATDEEVNNDIQSVLDSNQELKNDSSLAITDGDKVNIDFVGTVDGKEFEGGSSNNEGYDLTIGSGTFVDDFEDQLIGHNPGEITTVNVTFPDDYSSDEIAGKDASFEVTINGIYVTPEFNDEFVQTYLSDTASTADEYKASIEDKYYKEHLRDYIDNYILENSTVNSYPKDYLKTTRQILKYNDEQMLAYYNQMFSQYGMSSSYENVWDTRDGIDDELSYEKELRSRAKESVKAALVYQAIFEKEGISFDMDTYIADLTEQYGEEYVTNIKETEGLGYIAQSQFKDLVLDYLVENVKVE